MFIYFNTCVSLLLQHGYSGIMVSVEAARIDIMEYLIANKANMEHKNTLGSTALIISAKDGLYASVKCLVSHKANIEAKNNAGMTSLMMASISGKSLCVKVE
jgi:uncharacterized protein